MRRLALATLLALAAGLGATPALADCFHNGEQVPEGTRVGDFVCRDGQWVEG